MFVNYGPFLPQLYTTKNTLKNRKCNNIIDLSVEAATMCIDYSKVRVKNPGFALAG